MSLFTMIKAMFQTAPRRDAAECFADVRAGRAVLVDVREPREWADGVADSAHLLPLSDLSGARAQWAAFLEKLGDREVLVYCAAGGRSAIAAKVLCSEGVKAANVGAFHEWQAAGWRVVRPKTAGA
jgi:rhodanese-related sulfurtransferase